MSSFFKLLILLMTWSHSVKCLFSGISTRQQVKILRHFENKKIGTSFIRNSSKVWKSLDLLESINRISFHSYCALKESEFEEKIQLECAPFDDIEEFLKEHIIQSDSILFLGGASDLPIRLLTAGYGTTERGSIVVVDTHNHLKVLSMALHKDSLSNKQLSDLIKIGRIKLQAIDSYNSGSMAAVCKQSSFDSIIDYGGLDSVLESEEDFLATVDLLQRALRLGNVLVSLSRKTLPQQKERFCSLFEKRFGWIQEIDGDPGAISAWYRGKSNIADAPSNFKKLGINMYVYTNADNC